MKTHTNTRKTLDRLLPRVVFLSICGCLRSRSSSYDSTGQPYLASSVAGPTGQSNQVNNTHHTQFRTHFNYSDTINEYAGWYSGESDDSPPQLLVRYKE